MDDFVEKLIKDRKKILFRKNLMKLLKLIGEGEIDSEKIPLDSLYWLHNQPREEYISPRNRDSYNYGYMTQSEDRVSDPNAK